jgi:hypothetical protein
MVLRSLTLLLRFSSPGQSSSVMAIPDNLGWSYNGWAKIATLRAGRRPALATSAAPILPSLWREQSVATKAQLSVYTVPACPSSASLEEGQWGTPELGALLVLSPSL